MASEQQPPGNFRLQDATIAGIHEAFASGAISCRRLVECYLDRIEAYDRNGPKINSIITVNPHALEDADRLDQAYRSGGQTGALHGIPVILKDQIDIQGMPTTLGSVVFNDFFPDKDSFVVENLKSAGAMILAKATLGEMGRGDSHGSLYGSTGNPYDPSRTAGGSSGGSAASVSANFGAVAIGQEGFASIRRPSAWNGIVGMRPTAGLVSRTGVYSGWPSLTGSLGPMTRTVSDLATLLDVMAGYDPEDPGTALGFGKCPESYTHSLDPNGLNGARIGILSQSMGFECQPDTDDFRLVAEVFDRAVQELEDAGATVVLIPEIPRLKELMATRASEGRSDEAWRLYFLRNERPPYPSPEAMRQSPDYDKVYTVRRTGTPLSGPQAYGEYLIAREELAVNISKIMADSQLDAIVHKTVEHQPTLISEGVGPPYYDMRGATHINTFLVHVPSISVPAGLTSEGLPVGITLLGPSFSDATMIRLAYGYEQATGHRVPPTTTPGLPGEP